jgi:excinuclease UvrABC nuclease subunit
MNNVFFDIALSMIDGIGASIGARLVRHFKSAENVFNASTLELLTLQGINKEIAQAITKKTSLCKSTSQIIKQIIETIEIPR